MSRLMICLHGFTGTPARMKRHTPGLEDVAKRFDSAIEYQSAFIRRVWSWFLPEDNNWYQRDLNGIRKLMAKYGNPETVILGFSAGSCMAVRLGVSLREDSNLKLVVPYAGIKAAWNEIPNILAPGQQHILPTALFIANTGDPFSHPVDSEFLCDSWNSVSVGKNATFHCTSGDKHDWFPEADQFITQQLEKIWA